VILDNTKVVEGLEMFVVVKVHDFSSGELGVVNFICSLSGFELALHSSGPFLFSTLITIESDFTNN
jgi:hypothetical protein